MNLKAILVEKTSEKTGKKYVAIEVYLSDTYKRTILVSKPELEIITLANAKK